MNSPLGESRSGTPEGVRVPLDARRTLQVRRLDCAFRRSASFLFFLFRSSVPRPTVMDPALHCRIDLTKVGTCGGVFSRAHSSGANQKPRRENEIVFSSAPAIAGEGDHPALVKQAQDGGGGVGLDAPLLLKEIRCCPRPSHRPSGGPPSPLSRGGMKPRRESEIVFPALA